MQSKRYSLIEQVCNIGSGFLIALTVWAYIITPYLGIEYQAEQAMVITVIFTLISLVRGYLWRRTFNYITNRYES